MANDTTTKTVEVSYVSPVSNPETGTRLMAVTPSGAFAPVTLERLMELARDSIKVGGRNLIPNSKHFKINVKVGDFNFISVANNLKVSEGESFTASFGSMSVTSGKTECFQVSIMREDLKTLIGKFVLSEKQKAATITAKTGCEDGVVLLYAGVQGSTAGVGIEVKELKLERGNVPTDWTPAPEDLAEIGRVKITFSTLYALKPSAVTEKGGVRHERRNQRTNFGNTSGFAAGCRDIARFSKGRFRPERLHSARWLSDSHHGDCEPSARRTEIWVAAGIAGLLSGARCHPDTGSLLLLTAENKRNLLVEMEDILRRVYVLTGGKEVAAA